MTRKPCHFLYFLTSTFKCFPPCDLFVCTSILFKSSDKLNWIKPIRKIGLTINDFTSYQNKLGKLE